MELGSAYQRGIFEADTIAACSSCDRMVDVFGRCSICGCKVCKSCLAISQSGLCHACIENLQEH